MHNCHNPVKPTILPKQTANQHAPMQSYAKDGTGCTGKKHPVDFGGPMGDPWGTPGKKFTKAAVHQFPQFHRDIAGSRDSCVTQNPAGPPLVLGPCTRQPLDRSALHKMSDPRSSAPLVAKKGSYYMGMMLNNLIITMMAIVLYNLTI